jgi:type VI secretion system protein ImpF
MDTPKQREPLRPSVLDRLIGTASSRPGSGQATQSLAQLKESVRRDLEALLNTRWRASNWPPTLEELESSLVNYGIPDFTGTNMSSQGDRENFRFIVEQAIKRFEPRCVSVSVQLVKNEDRADRTLRFRVEASLHAVPYPEPVVFDTSLEPAAGNFLVRRSTR